MTQNTTRVRRATRHFSEHTQDKQSIHHGYRG